MFKNVIGLSMVVICAASCTGEYLSLRKEANTNQIKFDLNANNFNLADAALSEILSVSLLIPNTCIGEQRYVIDQSNQQVDFCFAGEVLEIYIPKIAARSATETISLTSNMPLRFDRNLVVVDLSEGYQMTCALSSRENAFSISCVLMNEYFTERNLRVSFDESEHFNSTLNIDFAIRNHAYSMAATPQLATVPGLFDLKLEILGCEVADCLTVESATFAGENIELARDENNRQIIRGINQALAGIFTVTVIDSEGENFAKIYITLDPAQTTSRIRPCHVSSTVAVLDDIFTADHVSTFIDEQGNCPF